MNNENIQKLHAPNCEVSQPEYQYEVHIFCSTMAKNELGETITVSFTGDDLLDVRKRAYKYYLSQIAEMSVYGEYKGRRFAGPENFIHGENAAFSIDFFFCKNFGDGDSIKLPLSGEGNEDYNQQTLDDLTNEFFTLMKLGYARDQIFPILFDGVTEKQLHDEVDNWIDLIEKGIMVWTY